MLKWWMIGPGKDAGLQDSGSAVQLFPAHHILGAKSSRKHIKELSSALLQYTLTTQKAMAVLSWEAPGTHPDSLAGTVHISEIGHVLLGISTNLQSLGQAWESRGFSVIISPFLLCLELSS